MRWARRIPPWADATHRPASQSRPPRQAPLTGSEPKRARREIAGSRAATARKRWRARMALHPLDELLAPLRERTGQAPSPPRAAAARFGIGLSPSPGDGPRPPRLGGAPQAGGLLVGRRGRAWRGPRGRDGWCSGCPALAVVGGERAARRAKAVSPSAFRALPVSDLEGAGPLGEGEERTRASDGLAQVLAQFERRVPGGFSALVKAASGFPRPACATHRPGMARRAAWLTGDVVVGAGRSPRKADEGDGHRVGPPRASQLPRARSAGGSSRSLSHDSPVRCPRTCPIWPMRRVRRARSRRGFGRRTSVDGGRGGQRWVRRAACSFRQIRRCGGESDGLRPEFVDEGGRSLLHHAPSIKWDGRATNATSARCAASLDRRVWLLLRAKPRSAPRRRVRRGRRSAMAHRSDSRDDVGAKACRARAAVAGSALTGRWSRHHASPEHDTVRSHRAGWNRSTLATACQSPRHCWCSLSGVPGGLAALLPVLREMEDVGGSAARPRSCRGLGPAQFGARAMIHRTWGFLLRAPTEAGDGGRPNPREPVVPRAPTDPGRCLYVTGRAACLGGRSRAADAEGAGGARSPVRRVARAASVPSGWAAWPALYAAAGLRSAAVVHGRRETRLARVRAGPLVAPNEDDAPPERRRSRSGPARRWS